MPYIKQIERDTIGPLDYGQVPVKNPGQLNYCITKIIHSYVEDLGLRYATLNEAMGVLESAKQEFYRTVVAPYEDQKRKENGSVSELDKERSDE